MLNKLIPLTNPYVGTFIHEYELTMENHKGRLQNILLIGNWYICNVLSSDKILLCIFNTEYLGIVYENEELKSKCLLQTRDDDGIRILNSFSCIEN